MGRGRAPCCDKSKVKKGPWSPAEDLRLTTFIQKHGHTNWRALPKQAGLLRCGKSCRLRWINYLRPDVKRGNFTPEEELTIINLHNSFGNKWSKIASNLPGRTDNEIKNVWNTHLKKRVTSYNNNSLAVDCHKGSKTIIYSSCVTILAGKTGGGVEESAEMMKKSLKAKSTQGPSDKEENSINSESPTSSYESNIPADDGRIEIPLDSSDVDIWELFDSSQEEGPNPADSIGIEWFRFLEMEEDELGLTTHETTPPHEEMNLELVGPGFDYFPLWPSSPQNPTSQFILKTGQYCRN